MADHRSYTHNLSSCKIKAWKMKFRPERDSNPWPLRYRCSALPVYSWKIIYCTPSRKIWTCSMLTVTLSLLYRKVIPLRFLLWCDDLITLGCRRILVFMSLESIRESADPEPNWMRFGEHVVRTFADKTVSANSDKSSPLLAGSSMFFFPFSNFIVFVKTKNARSDRRYLNTAWWSLSLRCDLVQTK